jgi:hypothetical protein
VPTVSELPDRSASISAVSVVSTWLTTRDSAGPVPELFLLGA